MLKLGVILGVVTAVSLLALAVFTAEGAPSQVSLVNQTPLVPSIQQTVSVTASFSLYSTQTPNGIDLQNQKIAYSVWQNGKAIVLNQTIATGVTSQPSSFLFTTTAVITFTVPAICSAGGCSGVADNVTVRAVALVPTYFGCPFGCLYSSAPVNVTFSNIPQYQTAQNPAGASFNTFGLVFVTPILLAVGVVLVALFALGPKYVPAGVFGIITLVAGFISALVFIWW